MYNQHLGKLGCTFNVPKRTKKEGGGNNLSFPRFLPRAVTNTLTEGQLEVQLFKTFMLYSKLKMNGTYSLF